MSGEPASRDDRIRRLHRARPRSVFLRISVAALIALGAAPWLTGRLGAADLFSPRAQANVLRFLGEIRPYPLRDVPGSPAAYGDWLVATFRDSAGVALVSTLALSVAAIVLAGGLALLTAPLAARSLANPRPFEPGARGGVLATAAWRAVRTATRFAFLFLRSVPEYVWAFLLLTVFGVGAWPAVLALGLHNAGVLGRLDADVIENMDPGAPRALAATGANRRALTLLAAVPGNLGRFLLYFFYRWETCIREATVLGLLGFTSIGYFIQDARAGARYDEMVHLVGLGALIVILGDAVSSAVRRRIRRS